MERIMKKGFNIQIRYVILPLVIAVALFVGYVMNYVGYFKPVLIEEKTAGPFHLIYKEHMGPYNKIVSDIEDVEHWATSQKIDCSKSFGYYLDNPDVVEEPRLRSWGGCLIDTTKDKIPATLPEGFKTQDLPEQKYVVANFEGSPAVGPQRVYPKAYKYIEQRRLTFKGPVMEQYVIHSQTSMTTTYYFAVE